MRSKALRVVARVFFFRALILSIVPGLGAAHPAAQDVRVTTREEFKPAAEFLANVTDRRRRVVYTPYPVSAQLGVVRDFVHVSDGSAVLSRIDLVVDAPLPIVLRRAYHSARADSADFGAVGWRLTTRASASFVQRQTSVRPQPTT